MDAMFPLVFFGFLIGVAGVAALFILSFVTVWPKRKLSDFFKTEYYDDDKSFHSLLQKDSSSSPSYTRPEVDLTVVVPAMNEELRISKMLDECLEYFNDRTSREEDFTWEIIVVDDGSRDSTRDVVRAYSRRTDHRVRLLQLAVNHGKGGAVRNGVLRARGGLILFADADGATLFSDIENLEREIRIITGTPSGRPIDYTCPAVVIGSRAHLEEASIAERRLLRTILMKGFHLLVWMFAVRSIRDTQCGFKLFTRAAAAKLFPIIHIERWAFDVELLFLAEKFRYPIAEVPVHWHEVDGSKITPLFAALQMGRDLVLIWFRYTIGIWRSTCPA